MNLLIPAIKKFKRHKLAFIAFYVLTVMVLIAVFAGLLSPHPPDRQILEFSSKSLFFSSQVFKIYDNNGITIVPVKQLVEEKETSIIFLDYADNLKELNKKDIPKENNSYFSRMHFLLGTDKFGRDILS